jgi:hypothetical protein
MSDHADVPTTGRVLYAAGQATVVRIPVPGTRGLCIEFIPRGWVPSGGSTSMLLIRDTLGRRQLRLDYGYNVRSKTIDYHWNQSACTRTLASSITRRLAPVVGTAVGGVAGCIVGGVVGYEGGSLLADSIYDWGEGARFAPLPLIPSP